MDICCNRSSIPIAVLRRPSIHRRSPPDGTISGSWPWTWRGTNRSRWRGISWSRPRSDFIRRRLIRLTNDLAVRGMHRRGVAEELFFQLSDARRGDARKDLDLRGDLRQPGGILRKTGHRMVVDEPHLVAERPEEEIRPVQHLQVRVAQVTQTVQMGQQPQRVLVRRIAHAVTQLQELDDEVNVEEPALSELHASTHLPLRLPDEPAAHVVD